MPPPHQIPVTMHITCIVFAINFMHYALHHALSESLPNFCLVLLAEHNDKVYSNAHHISQHALKHGCQTLLYRLGTTCAGANIKCESIPAIGRDIGADLYYIINNYENLPDILIASSSNFKHGRHERRQFLIQTKESRDFNCANSVSILPNFIVPAYQTGLPVQTCKGFTTFACDEYTKWLQHKFCLSNFKTRGCFNVVFRTTRQLIQRRPKEYFADLYNEFNASTSTVAHPLIFAERALEYLVGGALGECGQDFNTNF